MLLQVSDRDPARQQPVTAQETSQGEHAATDVVVVDDVTLATGQYRIVTTSDAGQGRVDVDSGGGSDVDTRAAGGYVTAQPEEGFQGQRTSHSVELCLLPSPLLS